MVLAQICSKSGKVLVLIVMLTNFVLLLKWFVKDKKTSQLFQPPLIPPVHVPSRNGAYPNWTLRNGNPLPVKPTSSPVVSGSRSLALSAPLLKRWKQQAAAFRTLRRLLLQDPVQYMCQDLRRIRNRVEGQWTFCGDEDFALKPPCTVYSFGINYDFTFDDALGGLGCNVYSFDPSMNWTDSRRSPRVMFYHTGIGGEDTDSFQPRLDSYVREKTVWKMRTMKTLLSTLKHDNYSVDVLKMDIEASEWPVVRNMLDTGVLKQVKQLLLEWHIFPEHPARQTFQQLIKVLTDLEGAGFKSFHKNPHSQRKGNIQCDMGYVNSHFIKQ